MNAELITLLQMLERDDLDSFLAEYEHYRFGDSFDSSCIALMKSTLSTVLRRHFRASTVTGKAIATLWMLTDFTHLLRIDDDLQALINQRIDGVLDAAELSPNKSMQPLPAFVETPDRNPNAFNDQKTIEATQDCSQKRRVTIVSTFEIRSMSVSKAANCRRNLCDSSQEKEFLRAIRLYFPAMFAYPNITLRSFINLDKIGPSMPDRLRHYSRSSRVDVLLCTHDEDPVAGFELDSAWHDGGEARSRDEMKNKLFELAGIPLVRIRPRDPVNVRAGDFYDLLIAEQGLNLIRPERMYPRRRHDELVPVSSKATRL